MNSVVLVGNPNTGKTTIFNSLTGSREKVANWHGVTVSVKEGLVKGLDKKISVYDLPGIYSLNGYSNEEKIACEFLKQNKEALICYVCDANNLARNFILAKQMIETGYNICLVVNMANEIKNLDINNELKKFKIPGIAIDARKKKDIEKLKNFIKIHNNKKPQNNANINKITAIYDNLSNKIAENRNIKTERIDNFVLKNGVFLLLFLISIFSVFYITFGPVGTVFSWIINQLFNKIFDNLRKIILCGNISLIIKSFLIDGVIIGVQTIISFVPQIMLLILLLNILEDTGFMSRVSFMFDGIFKKFGLTGKSIFSLFVGFGCTTTAVMTTRNLENKNLRRRTILLLPFISCSAKLPIFLVFAASFFEKYKYVFVFALYLFSCLISLTFALIYKKILKQKNDVYIMEIPKYRLPNLKIIFKNSLSIINEFLIKIGTMISLFIIIVWFLQNFSTSFMFIENEKFDDSILYFLSNKLLFLFKPLGFENPVMVVSLLLGLVAKEMIVVGVSVMGLTPNIFASMFNTKLTIVFLIFILLYSPCISAIISIKNEVGKKWAIYVFVAQFLIAYLVAFLAFKIMTDYKYIFALVLFLILDICCFFVLRLNKKTSCRGNCNECKRI